MGKLILCSGKRTERPYVLPVSDYRIYSIEELCYYIYNNIYSIDESLFTASLVDWIGKELCLKDRAERLEQLMKQKADFKTLITVILCSADYYTEIEIKKLLATVDEIRTMPLARRRYLKANSFLKRKQYVEAAAEYDRLLISEEAAELDPKAYGDVLHNLAIARLHIYGPERALELFMKAYELNRRMESLRQYLCTLWLCDKKDLFYEKLQEYEVEKEFGEEIRLKMEQLCRDAKLCKEMNTIYNLKALYSANKTDILIDRCKQVIEGWIKETRTI